MKAMIIDDDKQIREGIRRAVNWKELGFDYIGCYANGQEALDAFPAIRPDLMLCDIEMPKMTGLELGEAVRNMGADTRILYLTAFSDFNYARSAMMVGAQDYILKPVKISELVNSIRKNVEKLKEQRRKEEQALTTGFLETVTQIYGHQKTGYEEQLFLNIRRKVNSFDGKRLHTILLETDGFDGFENDVFRLLAEELWEQNCVILPWQINRRICLGMGFSSELENHNYRMELVQRIREWNRINREKQLFIKAGISLLHTGTDLLKGYREALDALNDSFYNGKEVNIFRESPGGEEKRQLKEQLEEDEKEIRRAAVENNKEGLEQSMMKYKKTAEKLHLPVEKFHQKLASCYSRVREQTGLYVSGESVLEDLMAQEKAEVSLKVLEDYLVRGDIGKTRILPDRPEGQYEHSVEQAVWYMEEHYYEALSVSKVAEHVGKSDNYFSTRFKKETGISFTEYLTRIRIEKACSMLSHTTKQVQEISREVGFSDYLYFSKIFKKIMGCTPSDIRKN